MTLKSKKVTLFLLEGITDKISLGLVLSRLSPEEALFFELTNGDLCYRNGVNPTNVIQEIGCLVNHFLRTNKLKKTDLKRIVQVIDTDGAFISPVQLSKNPCVKTIYHSNRIETSHPEALAYRHQQKTAMVEKLIATSHILGVPFHVYYFSRTLEHVLHNTPEDCAKEEKLSLAECFEDRFAEVPETFLPFLQASSFSVCSNYPDSWSFIREGTNSLKQYCNFGLYFDLI